MSFWDKNGGTIKSAGIATVKGIGSGGKALGKAGYNAYKNHDSSRSGAVEKDDTESAVSSGPAIGAVPKAQLNSLPAPPKRVAPVLSVGEGTAANYHPPNQAPQPQYQPPQQQPQFQAQQPQLQQQFQQPPPPQQQYAQNQPQQSVQPQQPQQYGQNQQNQQNQQTQAQQYGQPAQAAQYGQSAPPAQYGQSAPPAQYGQSAPPAQYGQSAPPAPPAQQQQYGQQNQPQTQPTQLQQNQFGQPQQPQQPQQQQQQFNQTNQFAQPQQYPQNDQNQQNQQSQQNQQNEQYQQYQQPQPPAQPAQYAQTQPPQQPLSSPQSQLQQQLQQQFSQNQSQNPEPVPSQSPAQQSTASSYFPNQPPAVPQYSQDQQVQYGVNSGPTGVVPPPVETNVVPPSNQRAVPPPPPARPNVGQPNPGQFGQPSPGQFVQQQTPSLPTRTVPPTPGAAAPSNVTGVPDEVSLPPQPKQLPDPASFAPPPRHRDAVAASEAAKTSKKPGFTQNRTSTIAHPPPVANPASLATSSPPPPPYTVDDPHSNSDSNVSTGAKVPPPKPNKPPKPSKPNPKSADSELKTGSVSPTPTNVPAQATPENNWYQNLPPPKIFRPTQQPHQLKGASSDTPPPQPLRPGQISNPVESTTSPAPPVVRSVSAVSVESNNEASNTADIAHKKKAPPKPTKKPAISADESEDSASTRKSSASSSVPNFADELAAKMAQRNDHTFKASPEQKHSPLTQAGHENFADKISEVHSNLHKVSIGTKPSVPKKANPEVPSKPKIGAKPVIGTKPTVNKPTVNKPAVNKPALSPRPTEASISKKSVTPPVPPPSRIKSVSPTPAQQTVNSLQATSEQRTSPSPAPPPPPPARNYSRVRAALPPPEPQGPPQLNLELETGWFAESNNPTIPKDFQGLNSSSSFSSSSSGGLTTSTKTVNLRLKDLAIIRYKFTWRNDDISSVQAEIKEYIPSPILSNIPSKSELVTFHTMFGEHVASWSEHQFGKQVLRGECWDLAHEALEKGCGKHAFVSTYTHHGYPILDISGDGGRIAYNNGPHDEIRRGDILQFESCKFHDKDTGVTQTVGAPSHTSVITRNEDGKLYVLEQNVNGVRHVMEGQYVLKNLQSGNVRVYRPAPQEWAGAL